MFVGFPGAEFEDMAEQCATMEIPLYVKQDSGHRPGKQGRLSDALWAMKAMPKIAGKEGFRVVTSG